MTVITVTPELCKEVIETYVDGAFRRLRENGTFGRDAGSLIVARTLADVPEIHKESYFNGFSEDKGPDPDFYNDVVLYEHTWGDAPVGAAEADRESGSFTSKALQKVFGSFLHGKDYDKVLAEHPHDVARRGLIAYPGAIIRDVRPMTVDHPPLEVIVGYSGLWWYHDVLLAEMTAAGLRAELTKRAVSA